MHRNVHLIALAEFPASEREALLAVLRAAGVGSHNLCVSRLEPLDQGLPAMTVVSLPGWCCGYEGPDWLAELADDLGTATGAATAGRATRN